MHHPRGAGARARRSQPGGRRGRTALRHVSRHALVACLASALVAGVPGAAPYAVAQAEAASLAEARARLDDLFEPLARLRNGIDATRFDVEALGLELAFEDADAIVAYVHERVRLEPYHGLLRGAHGTLASGGGNALDQALLSAVLLTDAGYEVELRTAGLDPAGTDLVLAQLRSEGPGGAAARDAPPAMALPDELDRELRRLGPEAEAQLADLTGDVDRAEGTLAGHVELGDAMDRVRAAASEYAWVAYRWHEGEAWTDAHPVFGATPAALEGLEPDRVHGDEIPAELQHRFRFQVFVERRLGDELVVQPVTGAWERPVANTYGVALTYANVPDGLEAVDDAGDVDALMAASTFFFPMLNGSVAEGGMAFDMQGATVPPDAATSPFAAIFSSTSRALGGAAGALGGLSLGGRDPDPEPYEDAVSLTAQWLEFTFVAPGGDEVTHRRMITDRIGAEGRAAGTVRLDPDVGEREAFADLAGVHTFMLDPGRYADAYVLDRTLDSVLAMRGFLEEVLVAVEDGRAPPALTPALGRLEEPVAPLTLYSVFAEPPLEPGVLSYRPAPGLVVFSQRIDGSDAQVDVVANPRWSLRTGPGGPSFDAAATMRAGAWETRTESLVLPADGRRVTPAFEVLPGIESGAAVRLDGPDRAAVDALGLPRASRDAILDDLERGYVVVAPGAAATDAASLGWWRVDPATGETLGRGGDGRGQTFVEYLTSFEVSIAITAGCTVFGVHQCTKIEDPRVAGCCIIQNVVLAGAGVAAGVGLGLAYGASKALVIFGAMDIGYNAVGMVLPTVCS